ncbi:MAG TPA: VWA domain-containing protein [Gaiellaceae bacterium]|nr:VWA domain-containing protein [Gaiellaceae bacterium]
MSFSSPWSLLWLLAIPALAGLYLLHQRRRIRYAERWASPSLLPNLVDRFPGRRRYIPTAVLLAALAALIVGVARPHATVSVKREEATVMLAIDTSRSMGATDINPSRLAAAQNAANRLVDIIPKKFRVGIVSFSSRAQLALAPTVDRSLVREALGALRPTEGTAIGDAVLLSARLGLRQRASDGTTPPTTVLLISDGARDGGRNAPRAAAEQARRVHVPVYTVLVGTPNGVVRHQLPGGYVETIRVPPSPQTLQLIATTTGAQFFRAATDKQLREVYENLGSRLGHKRQSREITDLFAGGAGLLLLVGAGLSALWFRRVA